MASYALPAGVEHVRLLEKWLIKASSVEDSLQHNGKVDQHHLLPNIYLLSGKIFPFRSLDSISIERLFVYYIFPAQCHSSMLANPHMFINPPQITIMSDMRTQLTPPKLGSQWFNVSPKSYLTISDILSHSKRRTPLEFSTKSAERLRLEPPTAAVDHTTTDYWHSVASGVSKPIEGLNVVLDRDFITGIDVGRFLFSSGAG